MKEDAYLSLYYFKFFQASRESTQATCSQRIELPVPGVFNHNNGNWDVDTGKRTELRERKDIFFLNIPLLPSMHKVVGDFMLALTPT